MKVFGRVRPARRHLRVYPDGEAAGALARVFWCCMTCIMDEESQAGSHDLMDKKGGK